MSSKLLLFFSYSYRKSRRVKFSENVLKKSLSVKQQVKDTDKSPIQEEFFKLEEVEEVSSLGDFNEIEATSEVNIPLALEENDSVL